MKITGWANARIICHTMQEVEQKQKDLRSKGYCVFGLIEHKYDYLVFEVQIHIEFDGNKTTVKPL